MSDIDEVVSKVDETLTPEKFDVTAAIKGRQYPTDSVRIYVDEPAAKELTKLNAHMEELDRRRATDPKGFDQDLYNSLEESAQDLVEQIKQSSLLFNLRGMSRDEWEDIQKKWGEDPNKAHNTNVHWVAASVTSVERFDGAVDEREFDWDDGEAWYHYFPLSEWDKLTNSVQELTFASAYFDQAVHAGFLPRR